MAGKGPVFLNYDSEPLKTKKLSQQMISYGINGEDYTMSDLCVDENGSRFTVTAPDGTRQAFSTRLLGRANVQNICGAIAVSHYLGISLAALAPAVRQLESVPHRLQLIRQAGLTVIDTATAEMCGQDIYPAAALNVTAHEQAARDFLTYLTSPEAGEIFAAVGFTPLQ